MKNDLIHKTFEHENMTIEMDFTSDGFVDATEMSKHFPNKSPNYWLRNTNTIEYIDALIQMENYTFEDLVVVIKGGNSPGTWIHPSLAVSFARWLSPVFAVWCDKIISSILHGKQEVLPAAVPEGTALEHLEIIVKMGQEHKRELDKQAVVIKSQQLTLDFQEDRLSTLEHEQRVSTLQKKHIKDLVAVKVALNRMANNKKTMANFKKVWKLVHDRFEVNSYLELLAVDYEDIMKFLHGLTVEDVL